jgi:hypothetical protein
VLIIECNESTFTQSKYAVNLFVTMLLEGATRVAERANGRLPVPINFFLDEFGVIPPLVGFAAKANLYRSAGVRFVAFVQSIQQLRSAYGTEAESLLAAFNTNVFLCSGLSLGDREYASRLSGNIVVQEWRETQQLNAQGQWAAVSRTSQSMQRPLLSPADLQFGCETEYGRLAVVFVVDRPPMLVYFTPAWKLPVFSKVLPVFSKVLGAPSTQSRKKKRRRSKRRSPPNQWASATPVADEKRVVSPVLREDIEVVFSRLLAESGLEQKVPTASSNDW